MTSQESPLEFRSVICGTANPSVITLECHTSITYTSQDKIEAFMSHFACRGTALLVISVLTVCPQIRAQPDWMKGAMKEAVSLVPDESATEYTLYSSEDVEINSDGHAQSHIRLLTKILKTPDRSSGMLYESKTTKREVKHLRGWRISLAGDVEKLDDKYVIEVAPSDIAAYFDEHQTLLAQFPNTAAGDLIGYEYDVDDEDWPATHQDHTFQVQQPVHFSEFSVKLDSDWKLHASEWNLEGVTFSQEGSLYRWTARELPMRPEEKLMPPWSYLERRVTVAAYSEKVNAAQHFSNWKSVAAWVKSICDPAIEMGDSALFNRVALLTARSSTTADKIRAVAEFVRDNIRYVAVEVGKGRWEPHPSNSVFQNRYGDCKDKATLLRTMLEMLHIPSAAVLANATHAVHRDLPSPFQFNHLIVAIPIWDKDSVAEYSGAIAGGWIFYDPTDEVNPFGALPIQLQGSRVLVASDVDSALVELPYARPEDNERIHHASVAIQEDGSLLASVRIVRRGIFSNYLRYLNNTTTREEQLKPLEEFYSSEFPEIKISEYATGAAGDSAWVSFHLAASKGVKRSGAEMFFKPNIFPNREIPALPKSTRHHPIWFGGPELVRTDVSVELPARWKFDNALPSSSDSCLNVASLWYETLGTKNALRFTSLAQFNGEVISVADAERVRAFTRRMRAYTELTLIVHTQK